VAKRLDGYEDATWYGSRHRCRPHCIRRVPSAPRKRHSTPSFRPMCIVATIAHLSYTAELLLFVVLIWFTSCFSFVLFLSYFVLQNKFDLIWFDLISYGFVAQQAVQHDPQQIYSESTVYNKSTRICCTTVLTKRRLQQQVEQLYTTGPQHSTKSHSLSYDKSATNPQLMEQVEFGLMPTSKDTRVQRKNMNFISPMY